MTMMVSVLYKCRCLRDEVTVRVRYREAKEDMDDWMEWVVQPAVQLDHAGRSPACQAAHIQYAKIWRPENEPFIGGKPVVH